MPSDKTQRKLFLSPFERKAHHSSEPVPKCHNILNRREKGIEKSIESGNYPKEAQNDVLKRHAQRDTIQPC